MASRIAAAAGRDRSPIDLPLAAVAALAVGFAAFAMPGDLLSRAVEASGLPNLLAMAAPPLGTKARAALALAGAVGTFGAVFLLLRMLGRRGRARPEPRGFPEVDDLGDLDAQMPRLRRADVHPDAPARRPILAARELGEPEPRRQPALEPEPVPEAEPEPETVEAPDFDELELTGPEIEMIVEASPYEPEPVPEPQLMASPGADDSSVQELMARLERGLARRLRRQDAPHAPAPAPRAEPQPTFAAPAGDERLRSAIENLQRMAARG